MEKQISIWIDTDGNVCLSVPGEGEEHPVFLTPQEAVLIGNDLVELGQSRLLAESDDEEPAAWLRLPMQMIKMRVEPSEGLEPEEQVDQAWITCLIRDQSPENATLLAKAHVGEFGWRVVELISQSSVSREDFSDDEENSHYFDQALIDEIVLVFDTAPPAKE